LQKLTVVSILALGSLVASATPITFDISGTASGATYTPYFTAPGVNFTNQPFDFHLTANTANLDDGGLLLQADTATLTLAGLTSPLFVGFGGGSGAGLFTDVYAPGTIDLWYDSDTINSIMNIYSPALSGYDLTTAIGPVPVSVALNPEQRIQGVLVATNVDMVNFGSVSGVTFAADLSAAAPEPVSWALMGLGMAGIGLWRRCRRSR
jgi:hypothetical protein